MTQAYGPSITTYRNCCVPLSLHRATGLPEHRVMAALYEHGWQPNQGTYLHIWTKALRTLGVEFREIDTYKTSGYAHRYHPTLSEVVASYPVGTYLVNVTGHLLVMQNGQLSDHVRGARRTVRGLQEILSPVAPVDRPSFALDGRPSWPRGNPKRHGSAAWMRLQDARAYVRRSADLGRSAPTVAEVISATLYTLADARWDYRYGYLETPR